MKAMHIVRNAVLVGAPVVAVSVARAEDAIVTPDFTPVKVAGLAIIAAATTIGLLIWGSRYAAGVGKKFMNLFK